MSILCERPDSEFFRSIPDFEVAVDSFTANDVKSKLNLFGSIFAKHNVSNEFGLALVHRHFDMSENEVLVETLNEQKSLSVSTPWIINDKILVAPSDDLWKERETKMKEYVIPQTWSFDKTGNLKAFEYLANYEPLRNPPQSFVAELYSECKKLKIEGKFGIRRIDNVVGQSGWESTPDGTRSNVVVFGEKPDSINSEKFVTVLWYFDRDGTLRQGRDCIKHCYHCSDH